MHTRFSYLKKHPECALVWQDNGVIYQVVWESDAWVVRSSDFRYSRPCSTEIFFDNYYVLLDHMKQIQYNLHYWVMIPSKDCVEKRKDVYYENSAVS